MSRVDYQLGSIKVTKRIREQCEKFQLDHGEWLVCSDDEADRLARDYILDSAWAFRPSFLSGLTDIDSSVFECIQTNNKCEDNNPAILSIIKGTCGLDRFVAQAIEADGRGHFLSSYDGEELELRITVRAKVVTLFAYRTN